MKRGEWVRIKVRGWWRWIWRPLFPAHPDGTW